MPVNKVERKLLACSWFVGLWNGICPGSLRKNVQIPFHNGYDGGICHFVSCRKYRTLH